MSNNQTKKQWLQQYKRRKTNLKWDKERILLLIRTFENSPELWNTNSKEYKDRDKKADAISKMSILLNVDKEEICRKLHNLRCQMNFQLRQLKKKDNDGSGRVYESHWPYFEPLQFLIENYSWNLNSPKEDYTRIDSAQIETEDSTPDSISINFVKDINTKDIENPSLTEESEILIPTINETLVNSIPSFNDQFERQSRNTETVCNSSKQKKTNNSKKDMLKKAFALLTKPNDDHQIFGDFVAATLRNMHSEVNRRTLKRTIQKVILDITEPDDFEYFKCN